MKKIIYFETPSHEPEIYNVESVEKWALEKFSNPVQGLRIFLNEISNENDISLRIFGEPELLEKDDNTYIFTVTPTGGVLDAVGKVITTVLNPILKILMPKQSTPTSAIANNRVNSSNNSMVNRTNEPRPGERIPDIVGYVRAYPDLLMDYKIFYDSQEYETQFLCLGRGEYQCEDIRDGITPLKNIAGSSLASYSKGNSPGNGQPDFIIGQQIDIEKFPIMIVKSSNEADGSELRPPNYNELKHFTLKVSKSGDVFTKAEDPIKWDERLNVGAVIKLSGVNSWEKHIVVNETTGTETVDYIRHNLSGDYEVVIIGDDYLKLNVENVIGWEFLSDDGEEPKKEAWKNPNTGRYLFSEQNGWVKETYEIGFKPIEEFVIGPYLMEDAPEIMINLYCQNGLYKTDGTVYPTEVTCELILSHPENKDDTVFRYPVTVKGMMTDAVGATLRVKNPYPDAVNVSMRRIDNTDKGFNGSVIDAVKWRDLYAVTPLEPQDYGNVTLFQTVTKATVAALKLKERKLNLRATRIYNGVAKRNFADVVIGMHTDPMIGRRQLDSLDVDELRRTEQQLLDYFGDKRSIECGFTFDQVSYTYEDGLQVIGDTVNCTPYQVGNMIYFWAELPQDKSSMQFGHPFKIPNTDKRTRNFSATKDYTGVQVKYFDHGSNTFEYVEKGEQTNMLKIDLKGCQSKYLANIRANREYNKLKLQRVTHVFTANSIGLQASVGMRVDVVDNTRVKQNEGRIDNIDGNILTLSEPMTLNDNYSYWMSINNRFGNLENIPIRVIDNWTVEMLDKPVSEIYTGWNRDKTSYVIHADDNLSSLAMLVTNVEPQARDNNYSVSITCSNYDDRYYKDDLIN